MQEIVVFDLAIQIASIADKHPRHIAIDAVDIAGIILRSGRDYISETSPNLSVPSPETSHNQGSPVAA